MTVHPSHTIFVKSDFTDEEYARKNILAVQVIDFNLKTCKRCGRTESDLSKTCGSHRTPLWAPS